MIKCEIIGISVAKSGTNATLCDIANNRSITVPVINTSTANLIIGALRHNLTSHLQVFGKWVVRIHNRKHYKVFCLCFIDPDFGLQYVPGYSPLNMVHYKISSL